MNSILNPSKNRMALLLAAVLTWTFGLCPPAAAFPPAPYHLIYGLARDQYGTPLTGANSSIILETQSGVQFGAQVVPGLAAGVNYEIKVPMDAGLTADLYTLDALTVSAPFKMYVVIGTVTNLPIEMTGNYDVLGKPGGATRIDLTLGIDANGDGIPDAWERAYLDTLGLNIPLYQLNAILAANGQSLEQAYLSGLPLFDPGTKFQVSIVGFNGGSPVLQFPGMTGRSYTILGSTDLNHWTPLSFTLPGSSASAQAHSFYYSPGIQNVQVQVVLPPGATTGMFLKVLLQ